MNSSIRTLGITGLLIGALACGGGGSDDNGSDSNPLSSNECGVIGLSPRIINGTACSPQKNSAVVPIKIVSFSKGTQSLCSGTLITQNAVLTAAHCFTSPPFGAAVQVGGESISGSSVAIHPGFNQDLTNLADFNDVAILFLSKNASVQPIPLLTSQSTQDGDRISIFGYGVDDAGTVGTLRSGEAEVSSVTENHLATNYFDGEGSNTCQGDSGGPALKTIDGVVGVVGITSSGTNVDCGDGDLSLYTNTQGSSVLSFIRSQVSGAPEI